MSTNYYLHKEPPCECCGRPYESLHIGKSSAGWAFSLHVIPEDGINDLDDWEALWSEDGAYITDEYDMTIQPDEMMSIITERSWHDGPLLRHQIDGSFCIAHGRGTWDLIPGEFS